MNRLIIRTGDFTVRFALGDGAPEITGGLGGWQLLERVQAQSITDWQGIEPLQVDVPILLDGWGHGESVERDFRRLINLGRRANADTRPPVFRVAGPIPGAPGRFVLNGTPSWEDLIRRDRDGEHLRVMATLPLMEYSRGGRLKPGRKGGKRGDYRIYVTKKGQNLRDVSRAVYRDVRFAKPLGEINHIRDVRKALKPGTRLRCPRAWWEITGEVDV